MYLVYDNQNGNDHYSSGFGTYDMSQTNREFVEFGAVLADGGERYGVSALTFDSQEELLWMGNEGVSQSEIMVLWNSNVLLRTYIMYDYYAFNYINSNSMET